MNIISFEKNLYHVILKSKCVLITENAASSDPVSGRTRAVCGRRCTDGIWFGQRSHGQCESTGWEFEDNQQFPWSSIRKISNRRLEV